MITFWDIFQTVFGTRYNSGGGVMLKRFLRIKFVTLGYQDILIPLEEWNIPIFQIRWVFK